MHGRLRPPPQQQHRVAVCLSWVTHPTLALANFLLKAKTSSAGLPSKLSALWMSTSTNDPHIPLHRLHQGNKYNSLPRMPSWKSRVRGRPFLCWVALFICSTVIISFLVFALVKIGGTRGQQGPGLLPVDGKPSNATTWNERKVEVRDAYIHALSGYMKYAFPADELLPVTHGKVNV